MFTNQTLRIEFRIRELEIKIDREGLRGKERERKKSYVGWERRIIGGWCGGWLAPG